MAKLSRTIVKIDERLTRIEAMLKYVVDSDSMAGFEESYRPVPALDRSELKVFSKPAETAEVEVNATQGAIEAAAELGVDLSSVVGTGKGGKITAGDVKEAASG